MPKRADTHIEESASHRILHNTVPDEWIIRDVTERDYGVDCYIELVDENNFLTGEMAFVQMKAIDKIDWRRDGGYKYYQVKKTTTNYLLQMSLPTYIFFTDISTEEVFFVSVKQYVKEHYKDYCQATDKFVFEFYKADCLFSKSSFQTSFKLTNNYQQYRNEIQYFIANIQNYVNFQMEHDGRDGFMQIEVEDMLFCEAMINNIRFLQEYLKTDNHLPSVENMKAEGEKTYRDSYENTIFEGVLTKHYELFKASVLELAGRLKDIIANREMYYWLHTRNYIFNHFLNLRIEDIYRW